MKNVVLAFLCMTLAFSCTSNMHPGKPIVNIIFDTDIGNDVDDAIAMDLLYKYADDGLINILAEGISKEGQAPAEYMDILNNWYGYRNIPIGIITGGADCETDAVNYAKAVNLLTNADNAPLFKRTEGMEYDALPQAHILYRKILAESEDNSVTFVTVGFSTNLARLLDTQADEYSSLTGRQLVEKKVKALIMMAGCFDGSLPSEYNVLKDISSAQKVVNEWPSSIVFAPFELGIRVCYPATSIDEDFSWTDSHPLVESYKSYLPMPYDRPCWDPAALIYAVEGDSWFNVSSAGTISISDSGMTTFKENKEGKHRYLSVNESQASALKEHIVNIVARIPEHH